MGLLTGQNTTKYSQYTADQFTGNGSQTIFTLSRVPATTSALMVTIDGVKQHSTTYTLNANAVVFTEAPPSGSAIECIAIGSQGVSIVPADGTVGTLAIIDSAVTSSKIANGSITKTKLDSANGDGSGALSFPSGPSSSRPVSATVGQTRHNTDTGNLELYSNSTWNQILMVYDVDYLIVAGGGPGGSSTGGGGGAGGYLSGSMSIQEYSQYSVVIGAGGAGGYKSSARGGNSSFNLKESIGGGWGSWTEGDSTYGAPGSGGSGGGGNMYGYGGNGQPGAGTVGQGYNGGTSTNGSYPGGGGGAGSAGQDGNGTLVGNGGLGRQWLDGAWYASGGAGSSGSVSAGGGGAPRVSGTNNTGGGGGADWGHGASVGGSGGSGVVIVRYVGTPRASGGTITQSGGYTYHTFTSSGTFVS